MKKLSLILAVAVVYFPISSSASADFTTSSVRDVRITGDLNFLPNGGSQGVTNGGADSLFVGINVQRVDNFALLGFGLAALPVGGIATGGQLVIDGDNRTLPSQTGSAADFFVIRELFDDNQGWVEGTGTISNSGFQIPGVVSFAERAFGSAPWLDDSGAPVANFLGAFDATTQLNTNVVNGFVGVPTTAPTTLTFDFSAADAQRWVDQGFADLVIQVIDDGNLSSRFRLVDQTAELTVFTAVPEPSSFVLLSLVLSGIATRRKRR